MVKAPRNPNPRIKSLCFINKKVKILVFIFKVKEFLRMKISAGYFWPASQLFTVCNNTKVDHNRAKHGKSLFKRRYFLVMHVPKSAQYAPICERGCAEWRTLRKDSKKPSYEMSVANSG